MTETASSVKSILSRDSNGTGEFHFNNYSVDSNGTPNAGNSKIIMQHDTTDTNRILKFQIDNSNKLELESNSIKIYSEEEAKELISLAKEQTAKSEDANDEQEKIATRKQQMQENSKRP